MSTTMVAPVAAHTPIRRQGARPGAVHAALPAGSSWRTACGELLATSPRGPIVPVPLTDLARLLAVGSPVLCGRCTRVGDSVA